MLESRISPYKLKKIEQKPISVFNKRNYLSVNCITGNKPKKLKILTHTPLSNILPHYAIQKNNNNTKFINNNTQNNSKMKPKPKKININYETNNDNRKAFTPFKLRTNTFYKSPNDSINVSSKLKTLKENKNESPNLNKTTVHVNVYAKNKDLNNYNSEYNNNSIRNLLNSDCL